MQATVFVQVSAGNFELAEHMLRKSLTNNGPCMLPKLLTVNASNMHCLKDGYGVNSGHLALIVYE